MSLRVHGVPTRIGRSHLIENEAGLFLVDSGAPRSEKRVLRRMRELERDDLRLIFVTHAHLDHYGSAAALRRLTGAPIAIHRADADTMARGESPLGKVRSWGNLTEALVLLLDPHLRPEPTLADHLLDDGDDLSVHGLDAKVIHTPGHTPGSSCLLVEQRLVFVGDLISTVGRVHVQCFFAEDWSLIPDAIRRLQALRPELVYAGHGRRPLSREGLEKLAKKI